MQTATAKTTSAAVVDNNPPPRHMPGDGRPPHAQLRLRPYQHDALDALTRDWDSGIGRCGVVLPTGAGKTVVFAHVIADRHQAGQTSRSLVLAHRDELVTQAKGKLNDVAPDLKVGVVKAEKDEHAADVIVASVQTLAQPGRRERIRNVGLIIVDEAHHAVARTYRETLEHFGAFDRTPTAGFTATMHRNDDAGLGDIWETISYRRDILDLIVEGYLAPVKGRQVEIDGLDLRDVAYARGDYTEGALGDALVDAGAGQVIARAYADHAHDRQGVVFCPTVASAKAVAQDMTADGIPTDVVWGAMPSEARRLTLKRFQAGDVQVLANCMVLTEGWDAPWASCAVIARPTTSPSLYTQMVGRVLRPHPGKTDALVLDVVGVAGRHKLATIADLSETTIGEQVADGETLVELADRIQSAREAQLATGRLRTHEIELFGQSTSQWLQTYQGVWFIPCRESIFFLWSHDDGTWIGHQPKRGQVQWLRGGLSLDYAMAFATQYAEDEDRTIATRRAGWRSRQDPPSPKQLATATRAGIPVPHRATKAEVADLIAIHFASLTLDLHVRKAS